MFRVIFIIVIVIVLLVAMMRNKAVDSVLPPSLSLGARHVT